MNENLRRIEKAIKQVKKIKPDNDIEVKYVNQIKTLLYNLQRHIENDYRRLLDSLPEIPSDEPPDDAICTREVKACKDCRYFKRSDNGLDNMCLKHNDYIWGDNGHCDDFQAILGRCERCRHFKSVDVPLMGLCSKHDKSVGNDETCDDFVYKLLSERIADGTVGCKCNMCGRTFQKKDGYVAMKGDKVQAFLCEQCYETAYKRQFGRKEIEDRFKPCPMCNGKIMFNTTKDILEPEYQHIECSKCGFSWKCSPTLEDEDKLVEYINHSIDSLNNDKPKEVKP